MAAEDEFRAAFERLKADAPSRLPHGSTLSQNNVAREAGKDPSALKKSRFPKLIADIQSHIAASPTQSNSSQSSVTRAKRRKNRTLRQKIEILKRERDVAMSLLVEADTVILELRREIESLTRQQK